MRTSARNPENRLLSFAVLTALFLLLNYMGTALYARAENVTSIKPYGGVALALILIL
jgi:hypothetical protein